MPFILENLIILTQKDHSLVGEKNYAQIKKIKATLDKLLNQETEKILNDIDDELTQSLEKDLFYD